MGAVRIVDGEIVREGDPLKPNPPAQRPAGPPSYPSASAPPSTPAGSSWVQPFNWSARAIAVVPEPREESFFGWPGLDIFGAHLNSKHAVALGAATVFFGLWGFLAGTGVWVAYKSYRPGAPTAPSAPGRPGNVSQTAQSFIQSFLQPDASQGPQQGLGSAPIAGRGQSGNASNQGWQGRGQGYKLGSASG